MDNKNYGILMSLALAGMVVGVWSEIASLWTIEQNEVKLFSRTGVVAIGLYLLFLLVGLYVLLAGAWRVEPLNGMARRMKASMPTRWLILVCLFLFYTFFYLFSGW